jgi:site-specific recombinase XerD
MMSLIADLLRLAHRGGHALRHACATRLLTKGLSLKEIGDHLGTSQHVGDQGLRQGEHGGAPRGWRVRPGRRPMMLIDVVDAYLARQRSLGMRFESAAHLLRGFCRAMGNPEIDEVTPEAVAEFLHGRGALSASWMLRYKVLTGLYRFAVSRGYVGRSPLPTILPKLPPQQTPYVYSTEELRRLLIVYS